MPCSGGSLRVLQRSCVSRQQAGKVFWDQQPIKSQAVGRHLSVQLYDEMCGCMCWLCVFQRRRACRPRSRHTAAYWTAPSRTCWASSASTAVLLATSCRTTGSLWSPAWWRRSTTVDTSRGTTPPPHASVQTHRLLLARNIIRYSVVEYYAPSHKIVKSILSSLRMIFVWPIYNSHPAYPQPLFTLEHATLCSQSDTSFFLACWESFYHFIKIPFYLSSYILS